MADQKTAQQFEAGQVILRENTPGDSAYILLSGAVEISKVIDGQRVVLDRLGPGSIFGEMSLLDGSPRSATVTALETSRLSVVNQRRFQLILNSIPKEVQPLFGSLSERLRRTSQMVSALSLRQRLLYSVCTLIHLSALSKGIALERRVALHYTELVQDICRVLAFSHDKIEEMIEALAGSALIERSKGEGPEGELVVVPDTAQFGAFIDFLAEKLSSIPGFPLPSRKYSVLSAKGQEILYFLKNAAGHLPRDEFGRRHYDFDLYVKESIKTLGYGVKDAILNLQSLAAAGHIKLLKFSDLVQNKAVVYNAEDIELAQLILLQADEFDRNYRKLIKGR